MSQEEKKFLIPVPASTDPNDLGNIIKDALKKNYSVMISEGTAMAITLTAANNTGKDKVGLKEVEVRVGPSWFGFTVKWGK